MMIAEKAKNRAKSILRALLEDNKSKFPELPRRIQLETTSLCPCRCIMCPGYNAPRKNKFMEDSLIDQIIDECAPEGTVMQLLFYGDPLLDKRIVDIVRKCKVKELPTVITTVGRQLTPQL